MLISGSATNVRSEGWVIPPFLALTKYRGQAGQSLFYPADDWVTDFNHAVREWFIGMRSAVNIQRAADF